MLIDKLKTWLKTHGFSDDEDRMDFFIYYKFISFADLSFSLSINAKGRTATEYEAVDVEVKIDFIIADSVNMLAVMERFRIEKEDDFDELLSSPYKKIREAFEKVTLGLAELEMGVKE